MELKDIKGIGPVKLKKLENLGIFGIKDLFFHFPYRYVDRLKELKVNDLFLIDHENFHVRVKIEKLAMIRLRGGRFIVNGTVSDDTGKFGISWFNNPYVTSNYKVGDEVLLSGKPEKKKLINPKIRKLREDQNLEDQIKSFVKIEAIYSETRGINSTMINSFVLHSLPNLETEVKDTLPKKIINTEKLLDLHSAILKIHFPQSLAEVEEARKRLAFDEIYRILKLVQKKKEKLKEFKAPILRIDKNLEENLISSLSFNLTDSQKISLTEIYADIEKNQPMHRLLNGDVGSGKTLVAALLAAQFFANNQQVILLAPTGVLAKQHFDFFRDFFDKLEIKIHLVTSNTKKEIDKLESEILDSDQKELFIGTHALLYRLELFKNIGLIVIDEQHKFGVEQRELLENVTLHNSVEEKYLPHVLSMSATPIPRSLALTLYGDLEVSILQKPLERQKIITKCIYDSETLSKMYSWIGKEIQENKAQVYVVCPLIEESEKIDSKSATLEFENLKKLYPNFRIELLHGKLKAKDKDEILARFLAREIDILVSTSVIEVGINNPNATIMIIEGSERFGLAQLHQIRGRVGRSDKQSYCFLKTTNNQQNERLQFFADNQDGFAIAEYDLLHRGPGEIYGNTQSGLPKLKIASIFDIEFIKKVKQYLN